MFYVFLVLGNSIISKIAERIYQLVGIIRISYASWTHDRQGIGGDAW